ncbi:SDR family NAD(P)-dependent oxidoreductase [Nocardia anaemiae]|uniref:SDR family NAD(P)-dependent oxidoreductase n=1 Tax=Nocardia anaemiae TaxID=263910 RepID=UPI0007A503AD|nr:SDR family oxidoreductase [Nocardia anaemiae]
MDKHCVVVTGSTRGLGFALADAFLAAGCAVVVSGRTETAVGECIETLRSTHPNASVAGFAADVSRIEDVECLFATATAAFGRVDLWINNAGLGRHPAPLAELTATEIADVVAANLTGTMNGCVVALAGMRKQQTPGQIFNTEGFGSNGMKRNGMAVYGATKQAIRYFTRSMINEVAGGPICVGTIIPGIVVSDMLADQYRAASPRRRELYSAFADLPETIAADLVPRLLENQEHGAVISWLSPADMIGRMLRSKYKKRGLLAALDIPSEDSERVGSGAPGSTRS